MTVVAQPYVIGRTYNLSDFVTLVKHPKEGAMIEIIRPSSSNIVAIFSRFKETTFVPPCLGSRTGMPDHPKFETETLLSIYGTRLDLSVEESGSGFMLVEQKGNKNKDEFLTTDPSLYSISRRDRKSTRLNSSHSDRSRMPSSA